MFSISLHVILLAMVLVVAIAAAAVSFAPLYVVALSNAEDSAKSYKLSITREIALRVEVLFDNVQSVVSTMTAAAQMGSWAEGDVASITQWMRHGVTRSEASGVNMVFDNGVVWTAGYVRPDSSAVAAGTFALVKYNTTHGIERIVGTQNLSTLSTSIFSTTTDLRTREFFPLIQSQQRWGDAFVDTSLGVAEAVVLPCGAPIVLPDSWCTVRWNGRQHRRELLQDAASQVHGAGDAGGRVDGGFCGEQQRRRPANKGRSGCDSCDAVH